MALVFHDGFETGGAEDWDNPSAKTALCDNPKYDYLWEHPSGGFVRLIQDGPKSELRLKKTKAHIYWNDKWFTVTVGDSEAVFEFDGSYALNPEPLE